MRKFAASILLSLCGILAQGQAFPGSQNVLFPNYVFAPAVFTANGTTGTAFAIGGLGSGIITVGGTGIGSVQAATYTSGGTITGSSTQTCTVTFTGGATGTVALTGTDTIAGGTSITITSGGSGYAAMPTSATLSNGTATCSGTAVVSATAATATWKIQGSADGGTTWNDLPTAAIPTTAVPISTTAVSQTSTAAKAFCVNLAGFTNLRFATTSGTFNATSLSLTLTASSNRGYL